MNKILSIGLVLMIGASAWAAHSVDGVISTGEWSVIVNDPDDNNSWNTEMSRWGAEVEGGYLYWFCELSEADGFTFADFQGTTEDGQKKIYPALWIDADASTSTYLHDEGTDNCADAKPEWGTNHRGIDINVELGLKGDWINGSMAGTFNYWGGTSETPDDVAVQTAAVSDASWYANGYVLEARVSLSELETMISSLYDGVVPAEYWMVAVAVQGTNRGAITYGYDVGTPLPIAEDGSAVLDGDANLDGVVDAADYTIWADNYNGNIGWRGGDFNMDNVIDAADYTMWADSYGDSVSGIPGSSIPEPATMSLLGVGVLALIRRKK